MSYHVKIHHTQDRVAANNFVNRLRALLKPEYVIGEVVVAYEPSKKRGSRLPGYRVDLKRVRTMGPNSRYLTWEEWAEVSRTVNDLLDDSEHHADVWSTPTEVKGHYCIRQGTFRRIDYRTREGQLVPSKPVVSYTSADEIAAESMTGVR